MCGFILNVGFGRKTAGYHRDAANNGAHRAAWRVWLLPNPVQHGENQSRDERGYRKAQAADLLSCRAYGQGKSSKAETEPQKAWRAIKKHAEASGRGATEKNLKEQMQGEHA